MAKSQKQKKTKPKSAGLMTEVAVEKLAFSMGRAADIDEVLRAAGLSRQKLSVLLADDEISQAMETRLDAVLNAPWRFVEDHGEQTLFLKELITKWHFEIVSGAWEALPYGYSVMEAVYVFDSQSRITLSEIVVKPLEWFEPKNDGQLIFRKPQSSLEIDVFKTYPLKFFLTRRKPTFKQPYGDPLLSKLYWLWFFKTNSTKFWVKFLERFGSPLLVGKVGGDGRNQDDIDAMTTALLNAHAQSVISIDSEDDVNTVGTNFSGAGSSAFEAFDRVMTKRIQKVVLGQTMTSENDGGGSKALGVVHNEVRMDKRNSDLRMITPTVQEIIDSICLLNNFEKHTVILGGEQDLNVEVVERDLKLKTLGVEFNDQYVIETYGIKPEHFKMNTGSVPVNTQFKALPHRAFSFAASTKKLSPEQQEVEELTDSQRSIELLDQKQVNELIQSSETPEALAFNLMKLMPGASESQFTANLEMALYAADVLGYVTASGDK
ncbi:phage portal protein family protein [Acinetobacter tandoii]|uniref:phage portal protein family protein n=1 Tax=Acinetobacter tandoii TaxID=202954 RepID=UPI004045E931